MIFAAVETGNYMGCGVEYVRNLAGMVGRHVTRPYRFICLTDREEGFGEGIETLPVPDKLRGWWAKLALFRADTFPAGERVTFFDLDTLILGNIDVFADYDGPFVALGHHRPSGKGPLSSSVMAWRAGDETDIWTRWVDAGRPCTSWGDDEWIRSVRPDFRPAKAVCPGIVSYKFHRCQDGPPKDARVVIFCRQPKPHNAAPWAQAVWSGEA